MFLLICELLDFCCNSCNVEYVYVYSSIWYIHADFSLISLLEVCDFLQLLCVLILFYFFLGCCCTGESLKLKASSLSCDHTLALFECVECGDNLISVITTTPQIQQE